MSFAMHTKLRRHESIAVLREHMARGWTVSPPARSPWQERATLTVLEQAEVLSEGANA